MERPSSEMLNDPASGRSGGSHTEDNQCSVTSKYVNKVVVFQVIKD